MSKVNVVTRLSNIGDSTKKKCLRGLRGIAQLLLPFILKEARTQSICAGTLFFFLAIVIDDPQHKVLVINISNRQHKSIFTDSWLKRPPAQIQGICADGHLC